MRVTEQVYYKMAQTLSGGNLQKLILAREIDWFRDYIVFSEPTWGLDIASSRQIWKEIDLLRKKGAAVILISTNLDEILALADRIIVMYRGKVAGEFLNTGEPIKEKIGNCMQMGEIRINNHRVTSNLRFASSTEEDKNNAY